MSRTDSKPATETPAWSARNLPETKPTPMLRFSVAAVAAGLVMIVLASAVKDPVRTTGTRMEPARFTAKAQQLGKADKTGIVVAADLK